MLFNTINKQDLYESEYFNLFSNISCDLETKWIFGKKFMNHLKSNDFIGLSGHIQFSKVTGIKINEEPKSELKVDESENLKLEMLSLMDSFLKIKATGAIHKNFMNGSIDIAGKEILAEAIITLLTERDSKDKTKLLEGLKNNVRDWEAIDLEIEKINKKRPSLKNINRVSKLLEKYSNDDNTLILFVESTIKKFKNIDTLKEYSQIITDSKVSESTKFRLLNIYKERIKQIESCL